MSPDQARVLGLRPALRARPAKASTPLHARPSNQPPRRFV